MKFGAREAVDVVFKALDTVEIGNQSFEAGEPVLYFDSLKTTSQEVAATTVYAQGGKGNPRLLAWEGDKTVTFTFEDALISKLGLAILAGAEVIDAAGGTPVTEHKTIEVTGTAATSVMTLDVTAGIPTEGTLSTYGAYGFVMDTATGDILESLGGETAARTGSALTFATTQTDGTYTVMVDYYVSATSGVSQINIESDVFGGYFYIEGDTLFRSETTGSDLPAQLIIPKAKIQTAMSLTLAGSGDPSTFSFTADAFPGIVKGGTSKKTLSAIQIIETETYA